MENNERVKRNIPNDKNKDKLLYDPDKRMNRRLGNFPMQQEDEEENPTEDIEQENTDEEQSLENENKEKPEQVENAPKVNPAKEIVKVKANELKKKASKKAMMVILTNPFAIAMIGVGFLLILIILLSLSSSAFAANSNYSSACNTSTEDANLLTFINTFEGGEYSCTTDDGYAGFEAYDGGDGTITVGHGLTNYVIPGLTSYIDQNSWGKFFVNDGGKYRVDVGTCIPIDVLDKLQIYKIETDYASPIDDIAEKYGVELNQYQKDALTSFNYNLGSGYTEDIISAYASGGYEALWNEMKEYMHATIDGEYQELAGLKRRRKAEFILFVTGDYSNTNPSIDDYENYDSNDIMSQKMVCTSSSMEDQIIDGMRLTRPLRDNAYYYNQETDYGALTGPGGGQTLEGECAWYATGRAKEFLSYINSPINWTANTDGGKFCSTSDAQKFNQGDEPKAGSLVSWDFGEWGHVAFVEKVNDDGTFDISEAAISFGFYGQNARSIINSSNLYGVKMVTRRENCEKNNSGCFRYTSGITKSSKYRGFKCFIYLQEPKE